MVIAQPDGRYEQGAAPVVYELAPAIWGTWSAPSVAGLRPKSVASSSLTVEPVLVERTRYSDGRIEERRGVSVSGGIPGARYLITVAGQLSFQVKVTAK